MSSEQKLKEAHALHAQGRVAQSEASVREILESEPNSVEALLLLGVLSAKAGRDQEAEQCFRAILEFDPDRFEALFWMCSLKRRQGDLPQATRFGERCVGVRADDAYALNALGLCYLDTMQPGKAAACFERAASIRADMGPIFHNLGTAWYLVGRDLDACRAFDQALRLNPGALESLLGLGQALISLTLPAEAVRVAAKALKLNPSSAAANLLMASGLAEQNRAEEAEPFLRKAVKLDPGDASAQALLGLRLQALGQFKEANEHLRRSVRTRPLQGFAYFALVHHNKVSELNPSLIATMREMSETAELPPRELAFLQYGLGRALEGLGEFEHALGHFDRANQLSRSLKFGQVPFDPETHRSGVDQMISHFSSQAMQEFGSAGHSSRLPVLVVGMMRSGTTLVEQILASHPSVGGAGEQRFWQHQRQRLQGGGGTWNASEAAQLGRDYVAQLQSVSPGTEHVVDKMPANFELLGPIHLCVPRAKIIHMRRHPVDTCLSIYATPNRVPISYAHDREAIVFAYEEYLRLMAHWREVLPRDQFLEVDYESLVGDRKNQITRILDFLELPWDDAVLSHEARSKVVLTPSAWQVRQPIYGNSVDRWRRFEPWLGAFRKLL